MAVSARAELAAAEAVRQRDQRRRDRLRDQAVIQAGIRHLFAGNERHKSLADCGNPLPETDHTTVDRDQNGRVSIGNVIRCGSKQLCVCCAGRGRAEDVALVSWRVDKHLDAGKAISMLTVAPRHEAGELLVANKAALVECFADTWRSKRLQRLVNQLGIEGTAKVLEITHGANGFHPHLHVLLFHEHFIDVTEGEERELIHVFWVEFNKRLAAWNQRPCRDSKAAVAGVIRTIDPDGRVRMRYEPVTNAEWYGLDPNQERYANKAHGIDFVPITRDGETSGRIAAYVGKIGLEMTRSDLKTGKTEGSRSLFQIMADYGRDRNPVDGALITEAADVLKGVQLVSWTGIFHGKDPLYGPPTETYQRQAMLDYYHSQGLEPPDEEDGTNKTTVAGLAPDVHRAAERAHTPDGDPLMWQARIALERTGDVDDLVEVLNQVLTPVIADYATDFAYPIIRFAHPPTVQPNPDGEHRSQADEYAALRQRIRQMGDELRAERIARARAGLRPDQPLDNSERRWGHGNETDMA